MFLCEAGDCFNRVDTIMYDLSFLAYNTVYVTQTYTRLPCMMAVHSQSTASCPQTYFKTVAASHFSRRQRREPRAEGAIYRTKKEGINSSYQYHTIPLRLCGFELKDEQGTPCFICTHSLGSCTLLSILCLQAKKKKKKKKKAFIFELSKRNLTIFCSIPVEMGFGGQPFHH